ncbi:MAG: hypothetical protein ACLQJR_06935, partial [Stellaceae bacterium]
MVCRTVVGLNDLADFAFALSKNVDAGRRQAGVEFREDESPAAEPSVRPADYCEREPAMCPQGGKQIVCPRRLRALNVSCVEFAIRLPAVASSLYPRASSPILRGIKRHAPAGENRNDRAHCTGVCAYAGALRPAGIARSASATTVPRSSIDRRIASCVPADHDLHQVPLIAKDLALVEPLPARTRRATTTCITTRLVDASKIGRTMRTDRRSA